MRYLKFIPSLRKLALAAALVAGSLPLAYGMPFGGPGGHRGPGGMGGPGLDMAPQHIERMLESVGASAEQRGQIKQILQAAQADARAQRDANRALHEQGRALFTQPNVDARAAEDLRQKLMTQHEQASKRRMQAMLDVSRVLTPEQRKLIDSRMEQRRSMMERHRGERESLGQPTR